MFKKQYLILSTIIICMTLRGDMSYEEKRRIASQIYALSKAIEECEERLARARSCDKPAEDRYIRGDLVKKSPESYTPREYHNQCAEFCWRRSDTCNSDRLHCKVADNKPHYCAEAKFCGIKKLKCTLDCYKAFRNDMKEAHNQCNAPKSADDIKKIETDCKRLAEEWNNIPYEQRSETFSWKGSDYARDK
jgi:hypothetical protein